MTKNVSLRVSAATLNQCALDFKGNERRILEAISEARAFRSSLLLCPELSISGYGCEDAFFLPHTQERSLHHLLKIAQATDSISVCVGLPIAYHFALYNCAAFITNGKILGIVPKRFLAVDGLHYEYRWFKPWPKGASTTIQIEGMSIPFGDLVFELNGIRIGLEVCNDAWVSDRPAHELKNCGVSLILNPSASHAELAKIETRKSIVLSASTNLVPHYVYANLVGNESGRTVYDGGAIIASHKEIIAEGQRLSFQQVGVTTADLSITEMDLIPIEDQKGLPTLITFSSKTSSPSSRNPVLATLPLPAWQSSENVRFEEMTRIIALGLYDYLRKSHASGYVISLSGGLDSAAVAILAYYSLYFAEKELGLDQIKKDLSLKNKDQIQSFQQLTQQAITCVYQATSNSSITTAALAESISNAIGASHYNIDIDPLVAQYKSIVSQALGQQLTWEEHDVALQNIQARTRSPAAWLFANLKNALLLATSNRSEGAVGYATMDGDTSGSLSPIAGVDKVFLQGWAHWMGNMGPKDAHAIPELLKILATQPTAELRPLGQNQTDETDLMPYKVLARIQELFIVNHQTPDEIVKQLTAEFPSRQESELEGDTKRFFELFRRNQWKRERLAPSFHVDRFSLDPRGWYRFPILSQLFDEPAK